METATLPHGDVTGGDIFSLRQERLQPNDTQILLSYKPPLKKPPIFADILNPRTKRTRLFHVFVGLDSVDRAKEAFAHVSPKTPAVIIALPWDASPQNFNWEIAAGQTVDILSAGKHSNIVYELGCVLHQSGAAHVYGCVNRDIMHWSSDQFEVAA